MPVVIDPNGGNWRAVVGEPVTRLILALKRNTELRMNLEEVLTAATERRSLRHLSLSKSANGQWQAASNFEDQDRSAYSVSVDADPATAVKKALVAHRYDLFPEFAGFGEHGPVGQAMRRLVAALEDNARLRGML